MNEHQPRRRVRAQITVEFDVQVTSQIIVGDALTEMRKLPDGLARCCVTSPPYYGLRDYGVDGQLGLEATPDEFVSALVEVFAEVRRVLADDGTLWLNLGDSYAGSWGAQSRDPGSWNVDLISDGQAKAAVRGKTHTGSIPDGAPFKPKDLIGVPWMLAFALRADGWYLRSDVIWAKPNPMPESVTDRPTRSHEYLFLLSKSARYFYDAAAIGEPATYAGPNGAQHSPYGQGFTKRTPQQEGARQDKQRGHGRRHAGFNDRWDAMPKGQQAALGRNKRDVWTIATKPYTEAHFATFPPKLIEPCIRAGSAYGDTVLDPFAGSGTTGEVALGFGRSFVGIELNPEYAELARRRTQVTTPLFAT